MKAIVKTDIALLSALLFSAVLITGCASEPQTQPQRDPYNQADSQKSDARKAQDELTKETSK